MENFVERGVFEEYQKRLEDHKKRWDRRLELLEDELKENRKLTTSVAELAQSMKAMVKEQERQREEQERQGARLDKIESRDGEMWRKSIGYVLAAIASAVAGALATLFFTGFRF